MQAMQSKASKARRQPIQSSKTHAKQTNQRHSRQRFIHTQVAGGGYEEEAVYDFLEVRFCNIDNIHKVRGALGKLTELTSTGKYTEAELTHWYK